MLPFGKKRDDVIDKLCYVARITVS
jgi:hypothetical protein